MPLGCLWLLLHGQVRILQPEVQQQLLPAALQLARSGRLCGLPALHCLANLAQLLTGCGQMQGAQQRQALVAASPQLQDSATAAAYCRTAVQLLSSAATTLRSRKQQKGGISPSTDLARGRQRGKQQHAVQADGNDLEAAAGVLPDGLWMLGTQQHLLQLMKVLTSSSQEGMVVWATYCLHLLQDCAQIGALAAAASIGADANTQAGSSSASSSSSRSDQLSSSVLNVLAFAPGVLPGMWRWLAVVAGLPLEAPLQASRGLDIAAVSGGPDGLGQPVALVLGLFCRWVMQAD